MAFEKREGQGALFVNDGKSGKQPDWRGYVILNGTEYEIAGWDKQGQRGHFLSLSAKIKTERRDGKPIQSQQPTISQQAQDKIRKPVPFSSGLPRNDMNDEIPFAPEAR